MDIIREFQELLFVSDILVINSVIHYKSLLNRESFLNYFEGRLLKDYYIINIGYDI